MRPPVQGIKFFRGQAPKSFSEFKKILKDTPKLKPGAHLKISERQVIFHVEPKEQRSHSITKDSKGNYHVTWKNEEDQCVGHLLIIKDKKGRIHFVNIKGTVQKKYTMRAGRIQKVELDLVKEYNPQVEIKKTVKKSA